MDIESIMSHPHIDGVSDNQTVPYLWDLTLDIQFKGKAQRVSARNHSVVIEEIKSSIEGGSGIRLRLGAAQKNYIPNKDFILYIRDDSINQPVAIKSLNQYGESAFLLSILPDVRAPKLKERFFKKLQDLS